MKFITVRDLRTSPAKVWKTLPEEKEMVITNNGRPIALLTPITDANLEETIRAMRRYHAASAKLELLYDIRITQEYRGLVSSVIRFRLGLGRDAN